MNVNKFLQKRNNQFLALQLIGWSAIYFDIKYYQLLQEEIQKSIKANSLAHIMRVTMKELEEQLNPAIFQRIHRSTIVNLDRVAKVCSHMNGNFI